MNVLLKLVSLLIAVQLLVACTSEPEVLPTLASLPTSVSNVSQSPPTAEPAAIEAAETELTSTPIPTQQATTEAAPTTIVTAEVTPPPEVAPTTIVTAEVIPPEELMTISETSYTLAVSYSIDSGYPDDYPAPPPGSKWVVVVATLTNVSPAAIVVEQETLILMDDEGNEYQPVLPDNFTNPPIIGTAVQPATSYRGLVRYAIPQDTEAASLEWCPTPDDDEVCENAVSAVIP